MGLPDLMLDSARAWRELAERLKLLSEGETPNTAEIRSALDRVVESERRYVSEAIQLSC
jgi:hypothetical protein